MRALPLCLALALSSCAYSIAEIDTSKVEPECVRQCTAPYSSCVSGGPAVGLKTETLRACRDAYAVCIASCPAKR